MSLLREISSLCDQLPVLEDDQFEKSFQDVSMDKGDRESENGNNEKEKREEKKMEGERVNVRSCLSL